jgi:hypothetical protein
VSLYIHRNPGEEVDTMVSLAGARYASLPTAFKYRTSFDGSCSCGSPSASIKDQVTAQAAALTPQYVPNPSFLPPVNVPVANATFFPLVTPPPAAPPVAAAIVPTPSPRPAASEDPETLAGRTGRLVPVPIGDRGTEIAGTTKDGRPIRLVGPAYYVAQ